MNELTEGAPFMAIRSSSARTTIPAQGLSTQSLPNQPGSSSGPRQRLPEQLTDARKRGIISRLSRIAPSGSVREFSRTLKPQLRNLILTEAFKQFKQGQLPDEAAVADLRNSVEDFLRGQGYEENGNSWKAAIEYFERKLPNASALPYSAQIFSSALGYPRTDFRRTLQGNEWQLVEQAGLSELARHAPALARHLPEQEWFDQGRPVASVKITSGRQLHASSDNKLLFLGMDVHFMDGAREAWGAPVRITAQGEVRSAMESEEFRQAVLGIAADGKQLVPDEYPASAGVPRRMPGFMRQALSGMRRLRRHANGKAVEDGYLSEAKAKAQAIADAVLEGAENKWRELLDRGYTSPARFQLVRAQTLAFSPENADALLVRFFENVLRTHRAQSPEIIAFQRKLAEQPKFRPTFYGYVQFMGVPEGSQDGRAAAGTFDDLGNLLDILRNFEFDAVELLPFFRSPQKDSGYDISNHMEVDHAFGGNQALERFMKKAVENRIHITADLVANHVSNEHDWIKALEAGDESMLSRFVTWDDAVKVGEIEKWGKGFKHNVFLHTKGEHAGKLSEVFQIFPDNNPDTLVKMTVNGKQHKLFASFMNPFQLDVNLTDPEVFSHYLETIGHFANLGQMGTRMDAVIHLGKQPGTDNHNLPACRAFVELAKSFANHIAPGNLFVPELPLAWADTLNDWLTPSVAFNGEVESKVADSVIGFPIHSAIWLSLLQHDKTHWRKVQQTIGCMPPGKSIMAYLGLHDETFIDDHALRETLLSKGYKDFANRGVGDSVATLLEHNEDRIAMAHALLYSSKGYPAVYYRTIVGAPNNEQFFNDKKQERILAQAAAGEVPDPEKAADTRDLDRGAVVISEYIDALKRGYKPALFVRALNTLWHKNGAVRTDSLAEVTNPDDGVWSCARHSVETEDKPLLQIFNLTGEHKAVELQAADLERQLRWSMTDKNLVDLLGSEISGQSVSIPFKVEGGTVKIAVAPYQSLYLE